MLLALLVVVPLLKAQIQTILPFKLAVQTTLTSLVEIHKLKMSTDPKVNTTAPKRDQANLQLNSLQLIAANKE